MENKDRSKPLQAAAELEHRQITTNDLEEIFRQYNGLVFRAAYRVTGNASDAEDVLQTVFLRLARRAPDAGSVSAIESYLYRAAVNCALDLVRGRRRVQDIPLEEVTSRLTAKPHLAPDRAQQSGEIRAWLREAIVRLNPREAEIFILRFFEGKKNPEIAGILDTTPATIAVTLHRARERLQNDYQTHMGGAA